MLSVQWSLSDAADGISLAQLNSALKNEQLNSLLSDPNFCQRLKFESVYQDAVEDQAVEAHEIRKEEALFIPDDINYLRYNNLESSIPKGSNKIRNH